MIISASRRTDIPAFFADWFYDKIKKGSVLVPNPLNTHNISKIILTPEFVDCFVFWTKNPSDFINDLRLIDKYAYYFLYTITGYGTALEPNVPELDFLTDTFIRLSNAIGRKRVIWRYDPIIFTDFINLNYHLNKFNEIAKKLSGFTERCIISFVDLYKKIINNLKNVNLDSFDKAVICELAEGIAETGKQYGIQVYTCAEEFNLSQYGIMPGKCIDENLIRDIWGFQLNVKKDKNQRAVCGCCESVDIGMYNTCIHGCKYCYANYNALKVQQNYNRHDKSTELLIGNVQPNDKITSKKMSSCKLSQIQIL